MAWLKLTLPPLCLGSEGERVTNSGGVSKSFFFAVIMYVEHPGVYRNRAEQLVVLQLEVKAQFQGQSFAPAPACRAVFFFFLHPCPPSFLM